MKLNIALLPSKDIIHQIYSLREKSLKSGLSDYDPRGFTLPHLCLQYLIDKDYDNIFIASLKAALEKFSLTKAVNLKVNLLGNYENKMIAIFNPGDTQAFVNEISLIIDKYKISSNKEYVNQFGTPVGDHMKLIRQVKDGKINEVKQLFKQLPSSIIFNRLVLIDYDCQEKDILWERKLEDR